MSRVKRLPVMEDYYRIRYVGDPFCHEDMVAWTSSWWDSEAPLGMRRFREEVRIAQLKGNVLRAERVVSAGGSLERSPVIALDGSVYFLSDASLRVPMPEHGSIPLRLENEFYTALQLYREKDGKVTKLTHMLHGVEHYCLSPDEESILYESYSYEADDPEALCSERSDEEREEALKRRLSEPFVTEEQRFKADAELGYRSARSGTLWLLKGTKARCLLGAREDFSVPCWMPDSRRVLYERSSSDGMELCVIDTETGEMSVLASINNVSIYDYHESHPMIDEKDGLIIFAAKEKDAPSGAPAGLYSVPLSGGDGIFARRLISPEADTDGVLPQDMNFMTRGYRETEIVLMPDGYCYYTTGYRGDVRIARIPADAADAVPELITGEMINFHALSRFGDKKLLALVAFPDRFADLALVDTLSGEVRLLTDSDPWLREVELKKPLSVWTESGIQGFYIPPHESEEKSPAILYCHGGPSGFYCSAMNYELQALAAAGLGVLYANPRGGTGYGRDHGKIEYAYDGSALRDLVEFVDTVCRLHPEIDPERIGICGGSYGGYLALTAAEETERFKAASSHRAFSVPLIIRASSHSAGDHTRDRHPVYLDLLHEEIRRSALAHVDRIRIPLQILQSDLDANCVAEQANQVYAAMRSWNPSVPCEYIRYPDSGHGLTHKGPMELAVHHRNANMRWLMTYLSASGKE